MTEYLWIRPVKAVETIQGRDEEYEDAERRLWAAVHAGVVQVQLAGEPLALAHVTIFLRLYHLVGGLASPCTIPPDLLINLPELRAAFQGLQVVKHRVGRPSKSFRAADPDRALVHEMHKRLSMGRAKSKTDAAWQLEQEGRIVARNDLPESRVKRLTRLFATIYSG